MVVDDEEIARVRPVLAGKPWFWAGSMFVPTSRVAFDCPNKAQPFLHPVPLALLAHKAALLKLGVQVCVVHGWTRNYFLPLICLSVCMPGANRALASYPSTDSGFVISLFCGAQESFGVHELVTALRALPPRLDSSDQLEFALNLISILGQSGAEEEDEELRQPAVEDVKEEDGIHALDCSCLVNYTCVSLTVDDTEPASGAGAPAPDVDEDDAVAPAVPVATPPKPVSVF